MGHIHYRIPDIEAHRKFWITLGAKPAVWNNMEVMKLPGTLVRFSKSDPSGGSGGSVVNHVSLRVQDLTGLLAKMKAAGYRVEPSRTQPDSAGSVFTPDGERVELVQDQSKVSLFVLDGGQKNFEAERTSRKLETPIELHHIHIHVPKASVVEARDWYARNFGALAGTRVNAPAADLPGVNLTFLGVDEAQAPIKGRALDHIGFEVKNLEALCKKLEGNGVKFYRPYEMRAEGMATAYLVDPWGVHVELTEGLYHF